MSFIFIAFLLFASLMGAVPDLRRAGEIAEVLTYAACVLEALFLLGLFLSGCFGADKEGTR